MDRRSLLRSALGAGLAAVTTKLWLPPVSTALAQPERTVFVPPANGWVTGANWASGPDEQVWVWGTFDTLPNEVFALRPNDTVRVECGPLRQSGVMVVESVESIDQDWPFDNAARTRIRGRGVESYFGQKFGPPIATIRADRGTVTRSLRDVFTGYFD